MTFPTRLTSLAIIGVAAVAWTVHGAASHSAPRRSTVANIWIDRKGGTCSRFGRAQPYRPARACSGFQEAYNHAQAGNIVLVRCSGLRRICTFPAATLTGDRGSPGRRILFRAAPGYSVSFDAPPQSGVSEEFVDLHNVNFSNIDFGDNNVGGFIPNLRIQCSSYVTLMNSGGRRFHIFEGTSHVTFLGGSWGGYHEPGEQDSGMGTTGADGPAETCPGDSAPKPASYITFDRVTWHDVFMNTTPSQWGDSHPDCFEINGYTDHVTIENSRFYNCGSTFFSLYGNQGPDTNLLFKNNVLFNLNDNTRSIEYYGVQIHSQPNSAATPGAGALGNVVLEGNRVDPNNPHAPYPYSGFLVDDVVRVAGMNTILIAFNRLRMLERPSDCRLSQSVGARWMRNTWLLKRSPRARCGK